MVPRALRRSPAMRIGMVQDSYAQPCDRRHLTLKLSFACGLSKIITILSRASGAASRVLKWHMTCIPFSSTSPVDILRTRFSRISRSLTAPSSPRILTFTRRSLVFGILRVYLAACRYCPTRLILEFIEIAVVSLFAISSRAKRRVARLGTTGAIINPGQVHEWSDQGGDCGLWSH